MEALLPVSSVILGVTAGLTAFQYKKNKDIEQQFDKLLPMVDLTSLSEPAPIIKNKLKDGEGRFKLRVTFRNGKDPIVKYYKSKRVSDAQDTARIILNSLEDNGKLNGIKLIRFGRIGRGDRFAHGQGFHVRRLDEDYEFIRLRDLR